MSSAAGPHGPASPQGESSADMEVSPGAAPPADRSGPAPPADPSGAAPPADPLDALAGDLAPASLGALAAEPPVATAERRREEAVNTAWRFLAHRERTEAEVRTRLARNDVEPALIDEVLDSLREGGYVDDAGFAARFAEDRRNLDSWGSDRIERRLLELGIDRHLVAAALDIDTHDELASATALLARRFPVPPDTPRDLERALGFLVRKGFDLELAHDAIRRHAAAAVEG